MNSILLSHGSGAGLDVLLREVIFPALDQGDKTPPEDAAVIDAGGSRLAFTTDSFVVQPLEFPGGDIGKLAACGTINDLAMMGATPRWMSVALIIEEGFSAELLRSLLLSLRTVCDRTGVRIVCGDTKVVDRGKADGLFITTSGVGSLPAGRSLSVANAVAGDAVLVNGPIGQHGITVLAARKGLAFASEARSDCAPLAEISERLLQACPCIRLMRDATRGGVAAVLNEVAAASNVSVRVIERDVPVSDVVRGACSYLGMDPLGIANEGRLVAVLPGADAQRALDALRGHELGAGAAIIGTVTERGRFPVLMETSIGGTRPVELPAGELLPRIC